MKEFTKRLRVAPFNYEVNIILTDDVAQSRVKRNNRLGFIRKDKVEAVALHTAMRDEPVSYLFFPLECDIGYVAHECFHCVWRIMEYITAEHENEVMAYTLGYLVRRCVAFIMKCTEASDNLSK